MSDSEANSQANADVLLELADDLADDIFARLQGPGRADIEAIVAAVGSPELSAAFAQLKAAGDLTGIDRNPSARSTEAQSALASFIRAAHQTKAAPKQTLPFKLRMGLRSDPK